MNYIDRIAIDIYNRGHAAHNRTMPDDDLMRLFRIYAVLALTTGTTTTDEQVHDAWSAWQAGRADGLGGDHRSLVPFADLTDEVKAMDRPYRDAIRWTALKMRIA